MRRRQFLGSAMAVAGFAVKANSAVTSYDVRDYGARGDGKAMDTAAIQKAIDACAGRGGGRVVLPPGGIYLSGTIQMRSHVQLCIAGGATLKASGRSQDFLKFGALLFAKDADNVEITGTGTIDGNFHAYLKEEQEGGYKVTFPFLGPYDPLSRPGENDPVHGRPRIVLLVGCTGARLNSFTIRDAPTWTIHPIGCRDLLVDGVSILNDLRVPNCDGIDLDHCQDVRVVNCQIRAGDDCIVVKTSRNFTAFGPCENIAVTGCNLVSSSAAIKVEPEGPEVIRNVTVTGCTIHGSNRGICILNRDGSLIENILCSDLVIGTELRAAMWWGAGEPVHISNLQRTPGTRVGPVRRLRFTNLICYGESGLYLCGGNETPIEDVVFDNVEVRVQKTSELPGGFYDLRPGENNQGLYKSSVAGIYCEKIQDLSFVQVKVRWAPNLPDYYGTGLEANHVSGLDLLNCHIEGAHPGRDAARLIDGKAS